MQAIFLVLSLHKTQAEAAEAVGVSRQTVNQWLRNYSCEGEKALLDRRLNAHRRGKGRLTDAEARRLKAWIADKCPEQLKLPFALWTAGVVRELIRRRLGKQLGLSTVQLYLLKWGFTPQKPLLRATQRSDAAILHWLENDYPKIARRAKREKALITGATRPGSAIRTRLAAATRRRDRHRLFAGLRKSSEPVCREHAPVGATAIATFDCIACSAREGDHPS